MVSRPQKHSVQSSLGKFNYLLFDSVFAFDAFVDLESSNLKGSNQNNWTAVKDNTRLGLERGSDWYGKPTPKNIEELERHRIFLGMSLTEKIQSKIKDKLSAYLQYLDSNVLPKPKLVYHERAMGVFCFERAAMGLYKNFEVDTKTPLTTSVSQMKIALDNRAIQTSIKSVYGYFQDKNSSYPSLELNIMAGANANVKGNDILYVGIACGELVDFLEQRGISVQVNVLLGTSFKNQLVMGCIRVKRFQDKLDKNQLLLLSSDPRYFRYRGFKGLIAMSNYFGLSIPSSLGRMLSSMGNVFIEATAQKGFVFEQSYAMDSAVKEVSKIIENYKESLS